MASSLLLSSALSSPPFLSLKPHLLRPPGFASSFTNLRKSFHQRRIRKGACRAELSQDAPFAIAIGACMLNSLVFPVTSGADDDGDTVIDSTDARFAVMGIISFIPYFNWLSWVFAWMDTGKRRYIIYSIVYLAPYLRSNLSLLPEDSWLPIASIVFCIIHIQLEASIRNGDIQGFQLFSEIENHLSSITGKKNTLKDHQGTTKEGKRKEHTSLPSAEEQSRNEIRWWGVPRKPSQEPEHLNEDEDEDDRRQW
ncbi:hypothetical protein PVL29_001714 [Vitis rotundifolia]|uniref:Uncharacterized protein n=1 Tax=Vitis rotundifolia TaxID=103349 RepID=A0AA39AFY0_VITRO|nr:hypothetical protein PVL29_001714 [Vitis rotundifolia]